jgi:anti-sigma B factor antagonist
MTAKVETLSGCKILRVSGRIDFESALDFEHHINAMIHEGGDRYIIELSQVELLSSAGLRVMLSTAKRNASLALAAPSQVVRQVFEISHFNLLFKIFPTVQAAVAALKDSTVVADPEDPGQAGFPAPGLSSRENARSTDLFVPSAQPAEKPAIRQKVEATPPEPVAPVWRPSIDPPPVEAPAIAPPVVEIRKAPDATAVPSGSREASSRQVPPPLPSGNRSADTSAVSAEATATRPPASVARHEAKYPALLEVRAEGTSYPCKDGDVIGTEGRLALPYFSQITNLAPRHLLIGQLEGRWFVFTPKNVQHPFILDGVVLRAGERKNLEYVEHQAEFSGHVFGFRLVSQQPKEGFFSRVFGRKR